MWQFNDLQGGALMGWQGRNPIVLELEKAREDFGVSKMFCKLKILRILLCVKFIPGIIESYIAWVGR